MSSKSPVLLIIMDGWGVTAPSVGNAVTSANLKYWDYLLSHYPTTLLQASGAAVGLPWGKMGNSEVGHLTIGAGQIYLQSLEKINREIQTGAFFENQAFKRAINHVKNNHSNLHLIGLLGEGGVHAHQGHLLGLLELAAKNSLNHKTFLHLFLDGRDTARDSGLGFMAELNAEIDKLDCGQIASLGGRFFGMDRNKNWDRTEKSFRTMLGESTNMVEDAEAALRNSYAQGVFDEEFEPVIVVRNGKPLAGIGDNDAVIFFNFRADRARQLSEAFVADAFKGFDRGEKKKNLFFTAFVEYEKGLPLEVAFPRPLIEEPLAKIVSAAGLKQLHIAETEKYAHVTFFVNGLREEPFAAEDRILIPSPAVVSYDQKPEMSTFAIRDTVVEALQQDKYDFILINFANPDMVGHTGNLEAAKIALESVSRSLEPIVELVLKKGGAALITADHGNVEEIINLETGQIDKEHSNFPVPVTIVRQDFNGRSAPRANAELYKLKINGALVDVAPTLLSLLGLPKSGRMIGIDLTKVIS